MPAKTRSLLSITALSLILLLLPAAASLSAQNRQGSQGRRASRLSRAFVNYQTPDVTLVDSNGGSASLPELLDSDDPVVLQFIFTTCRTSCPRLSSVLANAQKQIASGSDGVRLVSISIDPEHDTPERLREYATEMKAGPSWSFFTGDLDDIVTAQKAFGVYHENKLRHPPTTLLRVAADQSWLRLDGLITSGQLTSELDSLRDSAGSPSP